MIKCQGCQILWVVTYCCQGSCVQSLLYKTHRCTEYLICKASVVQGCNFEPISPRFHQSEELRLGWNSKKYFFSELSRSQSYFCSTSPWMLSVLWLIQRSSFHCHWWWYLGSHVLQWILSLQLGMTRCPMTLQLRCVVLLLLGKWRGSTISLRYVVGTSLQWVPSSWLR